MVQRFLRIVRHLQLPLLALPVGCAEFAHSATPLLLRMVQAIRTPGWRRDAIDAREGSMTKGAEGHSACEYREDKGQRPDGGASGRNGARSPLPADAPVGI